jgi:hypothetical protein
MLVTFEGYFYQSMAAQQKQQQNQQRSQATSPQKLDTNLSNNNSSNSSPQQFQQQQAQQQQQQQLYQQQQAQQQQAFMAQKQAMIQQQQQKDAKAKAAALNARNFQALQHQRLIATSNPIQTRFLGTNIVAPEVDTKFEEEVKEEEVEELYKPLVVKTKVAPATKEPEWWAGIPLGVLEKVREPVRTICSAVLPKEVIGL